MDYSPAKTSAWFRGWGPNFDIHYHDRMVSVCHARGPNVMDNVHPSGCSLILIRQLFASSTGAYPHNMTSLRVLPYFDLTPFCELNQDFMGGSYIICA